jgi:hypothetical protein
MEVEDWASDIVGQRLLYISPYTQNSKPGPIKGWGVALCLPLVVGILNYEKGLSAVVDDNVVFVVLGLWCLSRRNLFSLLSTPGVYCHWVGLVKAW